MLLTVTVNVSAKMAGAEYSVASDSPVVSNIFVKDVAWYGASL